MILPTSMGCHASLDGGRESSCCLSCCQAKEKGGGVMRVGEFDGHGGFAERVFTGNSGRSCSLSGDPMHSFLDLSSRSAALRR